MKAIIFNDFSNIVGDGEYRLWNICCTFPYNLLHAVIVFSRRGAIGILIFELVETTCGEEQIRAFEWLIAQNNENKSRIHSTGCF